MNLPYSDHYHTHTLRMIKYSRVHKVYTVSCSHITIPSPHQFLLKSFLYSVVVFIVVPLKNYHYNVRLSCNQKIQRKELPTLHCCRSIHTLQLPPSLKHLFCILYNPLNNCIQSILSHTATFNHLQWLCHVI